MTIPVTTAFSQGCFLGPKFIKTNFPATTAQNYPSGSTILLLASEAELF
jgi:hypothetical protein